LLLLIWADHGVKNNAWFNNFATSLEGMFLYIFIGLQLAAFLIGYCFLIRLIGGDKSVSRFQAFFGFYSAGLSLGYFISFLLAVANWGPQEEARPPKLLSVMLAFFLAGTVAYFLAAMIAVAQKEAKDDKEEDEVENTTSALRSGK
jgi:hypothetical protein